MKGIIFTEFVDMVEDKFSPEMVDTIIESSDLPSGGAYTSVGTYDHSEIVALVTALSEQTNIAAVDLIHAYCSHLFVRFTQMHPEFFADQSTVFEFLKQVDSYIHVEVKKLHPDAELPKFSYVTPSEDQLILTYESSRHLGDVAEGLIRGCIDYFKEDISIERDDQTNGGDAKIHFTLTKVS